MDLEAPLSSTEITCRNDFITHSLSAVSMPVQGERPGVLALVNHVSPAHYTEERFTIPENPDSRASIAIRNMHFLIKVKRSQEYLLNLLLPVNPVQADAGSRVLVY
jgi:hypothetical protein